MQYLIVIIIVFLFFMWPIEQLLRFPTGTAFFIGVIFIGVIVAGSVAGFVLTGSEKTKDLGRKLYSIFIALPIAFFGVFLPVCAFLIVSHGKDSAIAAGLIFSGPFVWGISIIISRIDFKEGKINEEEGFHKGTKIWLFSLIGTPIIWFIANGISEIIARRQNFQPEISWLVFIVWVGYFYGYVVVRTIRELNNLQRNREMKDFSEDYKKSINQGENLPAPQQTMVPSIREAQGPVSGWFAKLRAKDAVQIAKAHRDISQYGREIVDNQTKTIMGIETRKDLIDLEKERIKFEREQLRRKERIENLNIEKTELENDQQRDDREIRKRENRLRSNQLDRQLQKETESIDQVEEKEQEDEYQQAYKQERGKGQSELGKAFGRFSTRKEAIKLYNEYRDDILNGRQAEELSESETMLLEELEDYFLNQVLVRL
jgi:hypothetical protein